MEENTVDVKNFGAAGNGTADDTAAIQQALSSGTAKVVIPDGNYRITGTLRVPSHTHIEASAKARLFMCGDTPKKRGDFLLTNADHEGGNEDIAITGGIWDGNNSGKFNTKADDLFDVTAYSGTVLNFFNVRKLRLENLIVANSVVYNIRMSKLEDFVIRNVGFQSDRLAFNQDGLHFGGFVRNGVVENIRALSKGQTNDDLLAFNADDSLVRLENFDLLCGPIENITVKDVYAEDCHTAIRILSVTSPIRNIRIENLEAGCRCFAINMDAARYCRTPLFKDEECPQGVGCVENIEIDNMTVYSTGQAAKALICGENNLKNFRITNFHRDRSRETNFEKPTLLLTNIPEIHVEAKEGGRIIASATLNAKKDLLIVDAPFSELKLN